MGKTKRPRGRPCTYTNKVADQILAEIAEGKSLRQVCKPAGMPPESTVRQWVVDDRNGFAARYRRARDLGLDALADETLEIADDGTGDEWTDDNGNLRTNHDVIARSRLRVDTRKWLLSKLKPEQYGDASKVELSGEVRTPGLTVVVKRGDGEPDP